MSKEIISYFSSESVTEGHPDKVCDQISDAILDACLKQDPNSRVACEVCATTNYVFVFGEITTLAVIDVQTIVREVIRTIGYKNIEGFDCEDVEIKVLLKKQSTDIALGVDETTNKEIGAGDQGIIFGFATNDTKTYMPLGAYYASLLSQRLAFVRKTELVKGLLPDGKTQVTIKYNNGKPVAIDTIVVSTQHIEALTLDEVRTIVMDEVIRKVIPDNLLNEETKFYINPTGRFVLGGPAGDSGLTGRKLIVDTYGGYARNGGGAFSGKDATKVDRSAAYMARYLAKNIVASGICDECELQLGFAIGVSQPVSLHMKTKNAKVDNAIIEAAIKNSFDLSPMGMIKKLNLLAPQYQKTSNYGHFGREDQGFSWENLDSVEIFKKLYKK